MKNLTLNSRQQRLVEENLSVVRHAIHKNIIVNDSLYGFEYDDLYQEAASGCARRPSALMKHATSNLRPTPKRSLPTDFVHTAA